jgi:hypothetical protein
MGNESGSRRPCLFSQLRRGLISIHPGRHVEIEYNQLRRKRRGDVDRLFAALRQANLASKVFKGHTQRVGPVVIIVDDKNAEGRSVLH